MHPKVHDSEEFTQRLFNDLDNTRTGITALLILNGYCVLSRL